MADDAAPKPGLKLDTSVSHSARIWNYWQITRFFDGLDLLPPGVVPCSRWRPDPDPSGEQPGEVDEFCGVARKPHPPSTLARP